MVISVILLITGLGIGSFRLARQNVALDLETDAIVAAFMQYRNLAKAGNVCHGMRFENNKIPQKIEARFLTVQAGCDPNILLQPLAGLSPDVIVENLIQEGALQPGLDILFEPPAGTVKILPDNQKSEISIRLKRVPNRTRKIFVEPRSGRIFRK